MDLPKIKSVKAIKKYLLHIVFTDDKEGDYNLDYLAGKGVFKAWDTVNNFFKVFINPESGSISWPGELDIDTINAYCTINNITADAYLTQVNYATY